MSGAPERIIADSAGRWFTLRGVVLDLPNQEYIRADVHQERIAELEKQNRILSLELRSSVTLKAGEAGDRMRNRIAELEAALQHEIYQHYLTCEGEGLGWHGPIPQTGDRDEV